MRQKLGRASRELRNSHWSFAKTVIGQILHLRATKDRHQQVEIARSCRFVERNPNRSRAERAQIGSGFLRVLKEHGARLNLNPDGVEKVLVGNFQSERAKSVGELTGLPMNAFGDRA